MECRRCLELMSRFLEGDLSSRLSHLVSGHLEACGNCRERFRQVSVLLEKIPTVEQRELPPHFLGKLSHLLDQPSRVPAGRRKLLPKLTFGLASLLALVSLLALLLRRPAPDVASRGLPSPHERLYLTPYESGNNEKAFTITARSLDGDSVLYLLPSSPPGPRTALTSY